MKTLILNILLGLLLFPATVFAQCEVTVDGNCMLGIEVAEYEGLMSEPSEAPASNRREYYDDIDNTLKCSEDGEAYVDCGVNAYITPEDLDTIALRLDLTNDPLTGDELDMGSANLITTGSITAPELSSQTGDLTLDSAQAINQDAAWGNFQYKHNGALTFAIKTDTATDEMRWGLQDDGAGNMVVLTNYANFDKDHDHPTQANPTLFIHSDESPDTAPNDYLALYHDQSNGIISSGAGGLFLDSADGFVAFKDEGTTGFVFYVDTVLAQAAIGTKDATGNQFIIGNADTAWKDHGHDTTPDPTLFIQSDTSPDTDNTQWLSLYHDKESSFITTGSGSLILNPANGKVGIGTNAPAVELDIVGSINATGQVKTETGFYVRNYGVFEWRGAYGQPQISLDTLPIGTDGSFSQIFWDTTFNGAWAYCEGALSGSIPGIDVFGGVDCADYGKGSGDFFWVFKNPGFGGAASRDLQLVWGGKTNYMTWKYDESADVFGFGSALYINDNNNRVGIGISTPDEKLEVAGNIHLDNNNKFILGTSKNSEIYYNGTNLIIDPNAVGIGKVLIGATGNDDIEFTNATINGDAVFVGAGSGLPFGNVYGNEIAWTQASAVQNTWYPIVDADMTSGELNLITHDGNGKITFAKAGRYKIDLNFALEANSSNVHIQVGARVNAVVQNALNHTESKFSNTQEAVSLTTIVSVSANDTLEAVLRTTDAGTPDITVDHLVITASMVGG